MIVGKPLINVGTIANNMKLVRPNDFGTSLDVLRSNEGGISENEINQLDQKFWNQIHNSQLTQTTFAIAYMEHDDYDINAFHELLPVLTKQYARVMVEVYQGDIMMILRQLLTGLSILSFNHGTTIWERITCKKLNNLK